MQKTPIPTEHQEQVALFQWAAHVEHVFPELKWMFAIPNGGDRNIIIGKKMKDEGVKPGVPDLCLPVARGGFHGLYIEMKRQQRSRVTKVQKQWHEALKGEGYKVVVCKGFEIAKQVIEGYLGKT